MLGAIVIGLPGGLDFLADLNPTLGLGPVSRGVGVSYWVMVFLPLWVVTISLVVGARVALPWEGVARRIMSTSSIGRASFVPAVLLTVSLSLYAVKVAGLSALLGGMALALSGAGDFALLVVFRSSLMARLAGSWYYEICYVGLPTLVWVSLYQYWTCGSRRWGGLALVQVALVVFLQLATVQKMPTLVFAMGIYIAWSLLKGVRAGATIAMLLGAVALVTALQQSYVASWTLTDSFGHMVFRMASSFPYYMKVYPDILPFQAHKFGLGLLGIGVSPIDNLQIFNQMYHVEVVQGSAAAAVHLRAYSHGGLHWAVFSLVVVALFIRLAGRVAGGGLNPIKYAFMVQSGLTVYYFSQTSLRGALLESYGIRWAIVVLGLLVVSSQLITRVRGGATRTQDRPLIT
jgi:hypothetical protein